MTDTLRKRIEAIRDKLIDMSGECLLADGLSGQAPIQHARGKVALMVAKDLHNALTDSSEPKPNDPTAQEAYLALFRKEGGL